MTHKVSIHFCPKRYKIVKLYSRLSCVVGALESQIYLRVHSFGMIQSGSLIRDHSDHGRSNELMNPLWTRIHRLIYHDINDLKSLILIRIISKERTLKVPCLNPAPTTCWICFLVVTSSNA